MYALVNVHSRLHDCRSMSCRLPMRCSARQPTASRSSYCVRTDARCDIVERGHIHTWKAGHEQIADLRWQSHRLKQIRSCAMTCNSASAAGFSCSQFILRVDVRSCSTPACCGVCWRCPRSPRVAGSSHRPVLDWRWLPTIPSSVSKQVSGPPFRIDEPSHPHLPGGILRMLASRTQ